MPVRETKESLNAKAEAEVAAAAGPDAVAHLKAAAEDWKAGNKLGAAGEVVKAEGDAIGHLFSHPVEAAAGTIGVMTTPAVKTEAKGKAR